MRAALLTTAALAIALPIGLAAPASHADSTTTTTTTAATTQATAIDANKLIGQTIYNAQEEKIGDVESVILNKDGKVRAVIVGVGGFLGLGSKGVAIDWDKLTVTDNGERVTAGLTKEQLQALPEYKYPENQKSGTVFNSDETAPSSGSTTAESGSTSPEATTAPAAGMPAGALHAKDMLGLNVRTPNNENVGEISDIVMTKEGSADGVVVDVGGFLGMGAKPVMLGWDSLQVTKDENGKLAAVANLSREQLQQMPEYKTTNVQ
jgi:sporulation protein YlmC with PRC-barrel domain